jgi:hypothetical protein
MNLSRNVSEIIRKHVTLEVESIDRMYLNVYQPQLQRDLGVVGFFRYHRGHPFAAANLMGAMTRSFVTSIESFAKAEQIPVITFQKGQRKDDIAAKYRSQFNKTEGVVFIGKAQEKASVFRTEKRYHQAGRYYQLEESDSNNSERSRSLPHKSAPSKGKHGQPKLSRAAVKSFHRNFKEESANDQTIREKNEKFLLEKAEKQKRKKLARKK